MQIKRYKYKRQIERYNMIYTIQIDSYKIERQIVRPQMIDKSIKDIQSDTRQTDKRFFDKSYLIFQEQIIDIFYLLTYLSIYLPLYLSIYLSIYLILCLSIYYASSLNDLDFYLETYPEFRKINKGILHADFFLGVFFIHRIQYYLYIKNLQNPIKVCF